MAADSNQQHVFFLMTSSRREVSSTNHQQQEQLYLQHSSILFFFFQVTFSKRYLLWWDCILIVGERNFPECRAAAAGWPEPMWPGDGGILPDAAEAPSRCDSMASPESSGGGTWTDLGAPPKSRPSIIHSIKNNNNKNCFRMSLIIKIKTTSASVDFQANPCPYPALCRPTKKNKKRLG